MKRIIPWLVLFGLFLLPAAVRAQAGPADWMDLAMEDALDKMKLYEEVFKMEKVDFSRNGFALYGGLFQKGQSMSQEIPLSGGVDYVFLGGGDQDVIDSDIYIRTLAGEMACSECKDTQTNSAPIVFFTPSQTDQFTVDLQLYSSREDKDAYLVLLVLKRVPAESAVAGAAPVDWMHQAVEDALNNMKLISSRIEQLDFTRNGFALYGGLLEQGDTMGQEISLSGGIDYVFLAGGDRDVQDSNIFVRTTGGSLACAECQDIEPDSYPIVVFTPSSEERFVIDVELRSSNQGRDAYVVLLILKRPTS